MVKFSSKRVVIIIIYVLSAFHRYVDDLIRLSSCAAPSILKIPGIVPM